MNHDEIHRKLVINYVLLALGVKDADVQIAVTAYAEVQAQKAITEHGLELLSTMMGASRAPLD